MGSYVYGWARLICKECALLTMSADAAEGHIAVHDHDAIADGRCPEMRVPRSIFASQDTAG